MPRALAAFGVGGLLAMAGVLMQALLRNPLADPYLLGLSGGAGLGGVLVVTFIPTALASVLLPVGSALGALVATLVVFGLAATAKFRSLDRLILTGVAISSFCAACVSLLLSQSDDDLFRGLFFWLLGDLSTQFIGVLLVGWLVVLVVSLLLAHRLNIVVLGEDTAASLGVSVQTLRWSLYWLAALATGLAVAVGGMIGFVGLVVPHALRMLVGFDHRLLLPASALAGGAFLMFADSLARTVLAPIEIPVGVVMGFVGAPVFIWMLWRQGRAKG